MATQADIDQARQSIDRLDHSIKDWLAKLKGSQYNTELDATTFIQQHYQDFTTRRKSVKVEGGYTKIQVGISNQTVIGMKGEFVGGLTLTGILAMERKYVKGVSATIIKGDKSDTIVGAKIDLLGGHKYERLKGQKMNLGASPELQKKSKLWSKANSICSKFGTYITKASEKIFEKSRSVQDQIGTATLKIDELTKKHAQVKETISSVSISYGDYKMVDGTEHTFDFANIAITANPFMAYAGGEQVAMISGQCSIQGGGSYVGPHDSGVSFSGTTSRFM